MYGTQAYTGDYHLTSFTPALLDGYLRKAGLRICEASVLYTWLFDIRARKADSPQSDSEFLHAAYFSILGRPADPSGLETHGGRLAAGVARSTIEDDLRSSEEARFLASHPSYLLPYAQRLDTAPALTP